MNREKRHAAAHAGPPESRADRPKGGRGLTVAPAALLASFTLLLVLIIPGAVASAAGQQVQVFEAVEDAIIREEAPDVAWGVTRSFVSYGGGNSTGTQAEWDGLWRFDLSSIPFGARLTDASLNLTSSDVEIWDVFDCDFHRVTSSWSEATVTWNLRPSRTATPDLSTTCDPNATFAIYDVTTIAQAWVSGVGNFGLLARSDDRRDNTTSFEWVETAAHEHLTFAPATLTVTLVSVPNLNVIAVLITVAVIVAAMGFINLVAKKERTLEDLGLFLLIVFVFVVVAGIAIALFAG